MESIYNNWDDAAEATLRRMVVVASNSPRDRNMFDPIEKYLSQWIIRLQGGDFHESDVDSRHGRTALLIDEFGGNRIRQVG